MDFIHKPVLLKETTNFLQVKPDGIYVDCTAGGGGHSYEVAKRLNENGLIIAIDRDQEAIKATESKLRGVTTKVRLVHGNYSDIKRILKENADEGVDGIIMDLGVSSYQLDNPQRGFSYQTDSILDMRMDKTQDLTAEHIVNEYDRDKLASIIFTYGEERWAKRIAEFIVKHRNITRIKTTSELSEIIKKAIPSAARRKGPHPAKRTFQAIRIEVNNELGILENSIITAVECLAQGGRICVITFHSLEDRIVKQVFVSLTGRCTCPKDLPLCRCGSKRWGRIVNNKPIEPTECEVADNPRSRSAKLRVFEKSCFE